MLDDIRKALASGRPLAEEIRQHPEWQRIRSYLLVQQAIFGDLQTWAAHESTMEMHPSDFQRLERFALDILRPPPEPCEIVPTEKPVSNSRSLRPRIVTACQRACDVTYYNFTHNLDVTRDNPDALLRLSFTL